MSQKWYGKHREVLSVSDLVYWYLPVEYSLVYADMAPGSLNITILISFLSVTIVSIYSAHIPITASRIFLPVLRPQNSILSLSLPAVLRSSSS